MKIMVTTLPTLTTKLVLHRSQHTLVGWLVENGPAVAVGHWPLFAPKATGMTAGQVVRNWPTNGAQEGQLPMI